MLRKKEKESGGRETDMYVKRLTFAMTLIGNGNGATRATSGKSQVAGTLVGVSVGSAYGACANDLVRGRLGTPASASDAVRTQVLV